MHLLKRRQWERVCLLLYRDVTVAIRAAEEVAFAWPWIRAGDHIVRRVARS